MIKITFNELVERLKSGLEVYLCPNNKDIYSEFTFKINKKEVLNYPGDSFDIKVKKYINVLAYENSINNNSTMLFFYKPII